MTAPRAGRRFEDGCGPCSELFYSIARKLKGRYGLKEVRVTSRVENDEKRELRIAIECESED